MARNLEAFRCETFQTRRAAGHVKDLAASAAMEVMMVTVMSAFVSRRLTGQVDGLNLTVFHQYLQISVDSCYPQRGLRCLSQGEDFRRQQRLACILDGVLHCIALTAASTLLVGLW
ncbi:hypothetical protein P608_18365 [Comamonas thiooxydans]|uniref:Uncharacterized protein n=1 Tax=Comamonas thiooxydans TaxID=363952 RepID=A0A0E3BQQ9_9BURK|nr:hypothetical protein P608_18365 [Comamonas thiooxydans]KGH13147.1 hypothetical protein P607_24060 [Comamonas thiooxydans]